MLHCLVILKSKTFTDKESSTVNLTKMVSTSRDREQLSLNSTLVWKGLAYIWKKLRIFQNKPYNEILPLQNWPLSVSQPWKQWRTAWSATAGRAGPKIKHKQLSTATSGGNWGNLARGSPFLVTDWCKGEGEPPKGALLGPGPAPGSPLLSSERTLRATLGRTVLREVQWPCEWGDRRFSRVF